MKRIMEIVLGIVAMLLLVHVAVDAQEPERWRGLVVAPEDRCSEYNRARDYNYPASVEWRIVERDGYFADGAGWLDKPYSSPYRAGVSVVSIRDTDIEHIVAAAEAHDSGLCAADRDTRRAFARDLLNLTIALPSVNRWDKSDKDAAEWLPEINRRWYAGTVIAVKQKYGLTVDEAERDALEAVLAEDE